MGPELFGLWLAETRKLQLEAYGADLYNLSPEEYSEHVRMNVLAACVELGEFIQLTNWKPWSVKRGIRPQYRDQAVDELVDLLHFVGNLLIGMRVTDDELNAAYAAKMAVNRARQESGTY